MAKDHEGMGARATGDAWRLLAAIAVASGLALLARYQFDFPNCPSDEDNWARIAASVRAGVAWPISGPLHFEAGLLVGDLLAVPPSQALAILGLASIPGFIGALWLAYRWLGLPAPWQVMVLLGTSSYFWAPLLESRPQQWGQALLALGVATLWRALTEPEHRARAWRYGWGAIAAVTAAVHVLSFAFLLVAAAGLALGRGARPPGSLPTWCVFLTGLLPGLLVLVLLRNQYGLMAYDLLHNHLQPQHLMGLVTLGLLLAVAALAGLRLQGRVGPALERWLLGVRRRLAQTSPQRLLMATWGAAVAFLLTQAIILPAEAWAPYGGSVTLFAAAQSGNLFLLGVLALGVTRLLAAPRPDESAHTRPVLPALCLAFAALCAAGLAASFLMLHTNWALRALNYGLPLVAPVALLAFRGWRPAAWLVCLPFAVASYVAAVRPAAVFSCG